MLKVSGMHQHVGLVGLVGFDPRAWSCSNKVLLQPQALCCCSDFFRSWASCPAISIPMSEMFKGSLEVKLPTIWTDEKQRREEAEKRERLEERRVRRKKMQMREKVGKSRRHCVFLMIWGSGGSKCRLANAAGAEPAGQMRDEKLHAVVARSTFPSQNVQSTWISEHFWKLRCRKSARRCGAKRIPKSKCTKHTRFGPLLGVAMSKKCTPLWREAHVQVKMYKAHHCRKSARPCGAKHISESKRTKHTIRTTFGSSDVEKVHTVVARSIFPSQKCKKLTGTEHFWTFRCAFTWQAQGIVHLGKSEQNVRLL